MPGTPGCNLPLVLRPMANEVGVNLSASFISADKSVLDPNGTGCLNLSGGFHDAGDHVKFGLPQSYAGSVPGWGMYEFPQAYQQTGTWNHALGPSEPQSATEYPRPAYLASSETPPRTRRRAPRRRWPSSRC